jgi:hypothetical protein
MQPTPLRVRLKRRALGGAAAASDPFQSSKLFI